MAGLRVGFQRAGPGPPVVFLHGGFRFDSRSWGPQLEALADEFTVVARDAPGAVMPHAMAEADLRWGVLQVTPSGCR